MGFSYKPEETTDVHKVRGQIGDTEENKGPRPKGRTDSSTNFSDEVITATITQEKNWQRATANMFERLAAEWSRMASRNFSNGSQSAGHQYNNVSSEFDKRAREWRRRYGYVEDDNTVSEGVGVGTLRLGYQATNQS